jgi:hypothetical protein
MLIVLNVLVSASVISFAAWLSRRFPATAGFFVALPIATLLVLPLAQLQHGNAQNTLLMARSIFLAIPVTLGFFVPFLVAERVGISFWQAYGLGCALLPIGFFLHRMVTRLLFEA